MHSHRRGRLLQLLCLITLLLQIPMSVHAQERTGIVPETASQYVIVVDQRTPVGYRSENRPESQVAEERSGRQRVLAEEYRVVWSGMTAAIVILGGAGIGLSVKRCREDRER